MAPRAKKNSTTPKPTPPAYLQPNRPADYRAPLPQTVLSRTGSSEQQLLDGLI